MIVRAIQATTLTFWATIVTSAIELGHGMGLNVGGGGRDLISSPLPTADLAPIVRQANQLLPASDSTVLQIRALDQLAGRFRR